MKRKYLIVSLLFLMIATLCLGLAGCKEEGEDTLAAAFQDGVKTEVYVSKDIHLEDYIVKVKGADYTVSVSYFNLISGKTVSEVFSDRNMVFYPKMVGEHTLTYAVTVGKTTKTQSMKLSVIADPPSIIISHAAQSIPMPASGKVTRSFDYLMSNASMILKPMTATTKVIAAGFRGVNVGLDSEEAKWESVALEENSETYTFTKIGEYQFFVQATSEGNSSEDYFLVNVIKDPSEGTQTSTGKKVVETGRGVVYAENDPYTFKLMSGNLSNINYAVMADKLGDGKKLSVVFKGKNAPQLGFYVKPDEASDNPYNIKTTKGGFFSFVAKESSGHEWVFFFPNMLTGDASRTPIPGKNDFGLKDLESDKYYLMQYSLSQVQFVELYNAWRLKVNVEIYEAISYTTAGENSTCTVGELLYEIGEEGAFYFEAGKEFDFSQGSSVIYGDIRNHVDIQYIPDERNILKDEHLVAGTDDVYAYKGAVTANDDGSLSATLKKGSWSDGRATGISDTLGYMGITQSGFGMGKTIAIDFEGKNLPAIGVYLDDAPSGYTVGSATASGTGYYIGNGNASNELASIGQRITVNGPNRLDPGGVYRGNNGYPPYFGYLNDLCYFGTAEEGSEDYQKSAKMGYNLLEEGRKYRFELTDVSYELASDFTVFGLNYKLYDTSGDMPVLLENATRSTARDNDVVNFKSETIAFFSSIHQDISFTYSISGEKIEYPYERTEKDPDAVTLKSATITEEKVYNEGEGKWDTVGFDGEFDYLGLGEYAVGDTLEFRFKGKNIPNVGLFVNKNGAQPVGKGKENTGIFLQTSGYGSAAYDKRLLITTPYLLDAGKAEHYADLGIAGFTYRPWIGANHEVAVDISYTDRTSLFGLNMMSIFSEYIYRITTEAGSSADKVGITCKLYETDGENIWLVSKFKKEVPHYLATLENTYAVAYGTGGYTNKDISFTYTVNPDYDIVLPDLTLSPAQVREVKDGSNNLVGFSGTYDYEGLGEYAVGDTLEFRFTGKNIPNVALFTDKNGVNAIGGGTANTGIFLQTSGYYGDAYDERLYISGPFMLDAGSIDAYHTVQGLGGMEYRPWLGANHEYAVDITTNAENKANTSIFGIKIMEDGKNYLYRITTSAGSTAEKVNLKAELYTVEGETEALVGTYEKELTHYLDSLENRYAVVYGAGNFFAKSITFSFEKVQAN